MEEDRYNFVFVSYNRMWFSPPSHSLLWKKTQKKVLFNPMNIYFQMIKKKSHVI